MTKLIIFDLDGTLLDTLQDLADSCNYALAMCGCPPREKDKYRHFVGRGIMNLFKAALPEGMGNEENAERMKRFFIPYYNEHKCDYTRPYPGIIELLDKLTEIGIKIAVASNKYQEGTEELIKKYFSKYSFSAVLGQREGKPIKPDAGIIIEAIHACGLKNLEEVIYCGDSNVDMETGNNAKVKTIGVTWGFRDRDELQAYNPWLIVDKPEEIFEAIINEQQ